MNKENKKPIDEGMPPVDETPAVGEVAPVAVEPSKKAEEPEEYVRVKVDGCSKLNIRSRAYKPAPGKPDNVVGTVARGELGRMKVGATGEFVKVIFNNGLTGYAMKKYLVEV